MAKFAKLHGIVMDVLKKNEESRKDDYVLYLAVCNELGVDCTVTFCVAMLAHKELGYPTWETVSRIRRKIQSQHPELCDPQSRRIRSMEEEQYEDYATI